MNETPLPRSFDEEDLAAAVTAGVVPAATAEAFLGFVAARRDDAPRADEEEVRFVTSFNDVFVTLGVLLVCGGLAVLLGRQSIGWAAAAVAVVAWGLAELFSRRWLMAFPSIVLTGIVVAAAGTAAAAALDGTATKDFAGLAGAAAGVVAGFAHWRRFRVPISVAAAAAAAGVFVLALVHLAAPDLIENHTNAVILPLGLLVFALAMWWDASDRARRTRRTDVAFWLHVLAAPAIVHPLVSAAGIRLDDLGVGQAGFILALFAAVAVVALIIDRRAVLVSTLIYLGVSIGVLIERTGWSTATGGPATVGLVGAVILLLAVGWRPLRAVALRLAPARLRAIVPLPAAPRGSRP